MGTCILVVEDDRDLRECLVDVLRAELPGLDVLTAADGRQALASIEERTPALVLLDLVMPVMNGHEFLGALDGTRPGSSPPVVILTAGDEEKLAAHGSHVVGSLRKPVHVDQLVGVVRRWCEPRA